MKRTYSLSQNTQLGGPYKRARTLSMVPNARVEQEPGVGIAQSSIRGPRKTLRKKPRTVKDLVAAVRRIESDFEQKYTTINSDQQVVLSNANVNVNPFLLNGLTRGDAVQNREGDKIKLMSGKIRGTLYGQGNARNVVRIMVVMDKENNKTQLTNTTLFGTSTPGPSTLENFNNVNFYDRFRVLACKIIETIPAVVYTAGVGSTPSPIYHFELDWNCRDYTAEYQGGNLGNYSDITQGAIYVLGQQEGNDLTTQSMYINFVQYFRDN